MRIYYGGPAQARTMGEANWDRGNRWTVDVPAKTAAEALCQPGEQFEVAQDEELRMLKEMTDEALFELAIAGVGSLRDLANLRDDQAKEFSVTLPKLAAWKRQAEGILKKEE